MAKFKLFENIKLTVLIGYIVLFALAIFGLIRIYKELVNFSEFSNPYTQRKELSIVSNALVSMYEAESVRKVMLSENFYTPSLKSSYDIIDKRSRTYIDSLYRISSDEYLHSRLDTVNILLDEKKKNFTGMLLLMDSIKNLPYSNILSTAVLSKKDVSNLGQLVNHKMTQSRDTSYYVKERRSFIDRLRAVFVSREDSTRVLTSSGATVADSIAYTPAEILTDTLVQYINTVNEKSDKRKIAYMTKLSSRQNEMFYYDEMLTGQINNILRQIEAEEKQYAENLSREKAAVLKRSSDIVSNIAIASLFILILFLTLTMLLINRNQRYRNDLEKSNTFAQRLLKSRERLLLMISHDIKAPLSSIIGHIELISDDRIPSEDKEHLDSMRTSSEQILDLSNKLMDFHRLEQGKSELNFVPFVPHRLMEDIYKSFIPIADKKGLYLRSDLNIDPNATFEGDPFIIRQIVNNLISNSIKFTKAGGITLKSFIDDKSQLYVSVKDTGIGIKADDVGKIFDEFERIGDTDSKRNIDGFGLGLPITKRLVDLLHGQITLESEVGKGTEFKLTIPLKESNELVDDASDDSVIMSGDEKIPVKLLWVDDDVALLNVYSKLLERRGAVVTSIDDSTKVIDALKANQFEIIFTDIQMPVMNGFELVKKIRSLNDYYANVPIVALSARSDVSEKDFKSAGFTTFLTKPISAEQLYHLINRVVPKSSIIEPNYENEEDTPVGGFGALIEYVRDDKEVSLDILNTFLEDSRNKSEDMKKALKTEDWASIQSVSHKMLPLMTMIGEGELTAILAGLESGKKNPDDVREAISRTDEINESAAEFIRQFKLS